MLQRKTQEFHLVNDNATEGGHGIPIHQGGTGSENSVCNADTGNIAQMSGLPPAGAGDTSFVKGKDKTKTTGSKRQKGPRSSMGPQKRVELQEQGYEGLGCDEFETLDWASHMGPNGWSGFNNREEFCNRCKNAFVSTQKWAAQQGLPDCHCSTLRPDIEYDDYSSTDSSSSSSSSTVPDRKQFKSKLKEQMTPKVKKQLVERFQKLAGITPLNIIYEQNLAGHACFGFALQDESQQDACCQKCASAGFNDQGQTNLPETDACYEMTADSVNGINACKCCYEMRRKWACSSDALTSGEYASLTGASTTATEYGECVSSFNPDFPYDTKEECEANSSCGGGTSTGPVDTFGGPVSPAQGDKPQSGGPSNQIAQANKKFGVFARYYDARKGTPNKRGARR